MPLKHGHSLPAPIRHKKKSEIMRSTVRNRKQRSTYLPTNIKLVVKIALIALGFYAWETKFIWVLLGLYLGWAVIKQLLSCLVSLIVLIIILALLVSLIF